MSIYFSKNRWFACILNILAIFICTNTHAQIKQIKKTVVISDTNRIIQIIHASHFRQLWFNDSTEIQSLSGNAAIKESTTLLEGDSIAINKRLGIIEVFGHAHVNDANSVHARSQYLQYNSMQKMAYLKNDVVISDGRSTIYTNNFDYNMETGVGNYINSGRVINGSTTLTSRQGTYYADTKDILFEGNVKLVDPQYTMTAERLRYNTISKNAFFISPTHIVTKNGVIDTRNGFYNMNTGEAVFSSRTVFKDKTQSITGDKISIDEKNDVIVIEKNGKFTDTKEQVIVNGNQIIIDRKNNTFLATDKAVMVIYDKGDSTFIHADTLFSGSRIESTQKININKTDTIRYFIGFHHVKIFNDSIQAISDSLHYSTSDSLFEMIGNPLCWNGNTQLSGDTMHLYMENQQPQKLDVFNNAMVVHLSSSNLFDQMQGKKLETIFNKGQIDRVKTIGSPAESIFYPQDQNNHYLGMNKSESQWIEFFFLNKEVKKIKYSNDVSGKLYPFKQIPAGEEKLKRFNWNPNRRPMSKKELFE